MPKWNRRRNAMPLKNAKVFCINHPDEEMVILNENDANTFHAIRLAFLKHGVNYGLHDKSTGFNIFSCRKCGYAELYLTLGELQLLNKPKS
jgi:hypothetical protein